MKIKFYGVRGSLPVCGREFERYGGNTTCIRMFREKANRIAIFDAGTGIRNLGKEIINKGISQTVINILFSHFHWDHIQGLPFFAPAYNKNQKIGILAMGRKGKIKNLKAIFSMPMQKEYFPVGLDTMGAQFEFLTYGDKESFFGASVTAIPQHHMYPGGSYGFRIEDESLSVVVCTDVEHINGIDEKVVNLAKDADLLIHDGQYTADEYKIFKGWGHSSWEHAVEVAIKASVKKLIITHHDPDHDDDFLDSMEKECQKVFPDSLFAKEGMEVSVCKAELNQAPIP
jgi:phosphoribosyl 1,2-cyclic phosphodiesterase